jgi:hypothetical protein
MTNHPHRDRLLPTEISRRLKVPAREISVAVALTFAAAVQFISAASGKNDRLSSRELAQPSALQTGR